MPWGAPPEIVALGRPLTDEDIRSRYVDAAGMAPYKLFDAAIAQERLQQAEKIREWVQSCLSGAQP